MSTPRWATFSFARLAQAALLSLAADVGGVGCSQGDGGDAGEGASSATDASTEASTGSSSSASSASSAATSGSGGAGATGPGPASASSASSTGVGGAPSTACKATATPGTFYSFEAETFPPIELEPQPMCVHEGDVLLVVNTAALCGYTPQYTPLQALHAKYASKRFKVLGFLSNDFGNQGGSDEEVEACTDQYKVTFPQFAHVKVKKGAGQHPLFTWLTSQAPIDGDVTWNFNKWLISRSGELVARWTNLTEPDSAEVVGAIEAELAQP